ncbi:MAG TPA: flagellar biosynthesis protein FliQ [Ectothiorhodospiraceae bacterium]|nr:flagellar biosynthesis protein FliQ [Ectothiorhodospiraceae bacterium]
MTPEVVLTIFQQALELLIVLILIVLLPALFVGLIVAMFQAATSINEQTLSFIPKLIVTFGVLMLAGPLMLRMIIDFTKGLISNIPMLIG